MPHEKRGPCREIAELERRKASASRKGGHERLVAPNRRSGPLASLRRSEVCDGREMPGRVKNAGAGTMELGRSNDSQLVMPGLVPGIHALTACQ